MSPLDIYTQRCRPTRTSQGGQPLLQNGPAITIKAAALREALPRWSLGKVSLLFPPLSLLSLLRRLFFSGSDQRHARPREGRGEDL